MDCAVEKGEAYIFRHLGFVQMTFRVIAWCNCSYCCVRTQKNIQKNPCHCQEWNCDLGLSIKDVMLQGGERV